MSVSDPIADFLTCVRNAVRAKHRKVDVPATRMKTDLARVLLRERFINNFKVIEDSRQGMLRIYLKYSADGDTSVISGIRRASTPGRRVYVGKHEIPKIMGGLGSAVVSTSRGLMTDREAREAGLGGELVCTVW
jgi:small subunit ribosomal protein S8